eukprot:6472149-Pyramimonas_sp.AAC.1
MDFARPTRVRVPVSSMKFEGEFHAAAAVGPLEFRRPTCESDGGMFARSWEVIARGAPLSVIPDRLHR